MPSTRLGPVPLRPNPPAAVALVPEYQLNALAAYVRNSISDAKSGPIKPPPESCAYLDALSNGMEECLEALRTEAYDLPLRSVVSEYGSMKRARAAAERGEIPGAHFNGRCWRIRNPRHPAHAHAR